jgi:hypothetical protein
VNSIKLNLLIFVACIAVQMAAMQQPLSPNAETLKNALIDYAVGHRDPVGMVEDLSRSFQQYKETLCRDDSVTFCDLVRYIFPSHRDLVGSNATKTVQKSEVAKVFAAAINVLITNPPLSSDAKRTKQRLLRDAKQQPYPLLYVINQQPSMIKYGTIYATSQKELTRVFDEVRLELRRPDASVKNKVCMALYDHIDQYRDPKAYAKRLHEKIETKSKKGLLLNKLRLREVQELCMLAEEGYETPDLPAMTCLNSYKTITKDDFLAMIQAIQENASNPRSASDQREGGQPYLQCNADRVRDVRVRNENIMRDALNRHVRQYKDPHGLAKKIYNVAYRLPNGTQTFAQVVSTLSQIDEYDALNDPALMGDNATSLISSASLGEVARAVRSDNIARKEGGTKRPYGTMLSDALVEHAKTQADPIEYMRLAHSTFLFKAFSFQAIVEKINANTMRAGFTRFNHPDVTGDNACKKLPALNVRKALEKADLKIQEDETCVLLHEQAQRMKQVLKQLKQKSLSSSNSQQASPSIMPVGQQAQPAAQGSASAVQWQNKPDNTVSSELIPFWARLSFVVALPLAMYVIDQMIEYVKDVYKEVDYALAVTPEAAQTCR